MAHNAWLVARRPGVAVLLVVVTLMFGGFFMLIPFVSVYGTRELGLSAAAIGSILAMRVIVQQGLTVFGGAFADQIGYKPVLALGIFIRAVGFTMFAFAHDFWSLMLAALVAALGGVLFEATHKAALAALVPISERPVAFSLLGTAGRVGTMLGPLVAVVLLPIGFATLSVAAAGCFFVSSAAVLLFLPTVHAHKLEDRPSIPTMLARVWADRPFVLFTALTIGYWFLFNQLFLSLPLYVSYVSGSDAVVGQVLAIYSGFALIAQYPVVAWASRRFPPFAMMTVGCGLMAAGMAGLAFMPSTLAPWVSLAVLLFAVPLVVYTLGDLLVQPTIAAITGDMARPEALGSYFGFSALGLAIGGGLGNALGGVLFDQSVALGMPAVPWIAFALVAGSLAIAFRWFGRTVRLVPAHSAPEGVT
ncbi:MAG: MFS transporter [Anaerolineae bacterium]